MSFQWIINNAQSLSINTKPIVSITQARDGTPRAVLRNSIPAKIEVLLPNGPRWSDIYQNIQAAEALGQTTASTITIPYNLFPWYYGYVDPGVNQESYQVLCVQFPQWTIFARDQVSWSGPFVFTEIAV